MSEDARTAADIAQTSEDARRAAQRDRGWTIYYTMVWKKVAKGDRDAIARNAERIIDAIVEGMECPRD